MSGKAQDELEKINHMTVESEKVLKNILPCQKNSKDTPKSHQCPNLGYFLPRNNNASNGSWLSIYEFALT